MAASDFEIIHQPFLIGTSNAPSLSATEPLPLQQHAFYIAAMRSLGADPEEIIIEHQGQPVLRAYVLKRTFFRFIHLTSAFRGPLWCSNDIPQATKLAALRFLRRQFSPWRWQFLAIMPEMTATPDNKTLLHKAGFRRVITGSSTVWLDLRPDEATLRDNLDGTWRNQLKKAEKAGITISTGGAKPKHYNWLLEMEKDQRQQKGYGALPMGLVPAYAEVAKLLAGTHGPITSITAMDGSTKIAGALFLHHGNSATYHIGWANERARATNAQNRVLFAGMLALRQQGIAWLDLGGLDTGPQAGIARFKMGLGGRPTTLAGTYI